MIFGDNIREAVRSLWGAKQRSLLALIGIVIGIGSVIALVTVGQIVGAESLREFREMGTDVCMVRPVFEPGQRTPHKGFDFATIHQIPSQCSSVKSVAPYVSIHSQLTYGGKRTNSSGLGVTGQFKSLFKLPIKDGRFISDLDGFANFCVLSSSKAQWLAGQGVTSPVGEKIVFGDTMYTVVGVVSEVPHGTFTPYEINDGIMIPIGTAMRSPDRPKIESIGVRMAAHGIADKAARQLMDYFQRASSRQVHVSSAEELIRQVGRQMQMFTLLLGAIGSISLIVGGVGVMNVMLVSVSERQKEIGIRRAIGAERKDIQLQFIIESILLSFVGGIIGLAAGVGAVAAICHFTQWTFAFSVMATTLGVGVSCAVGLFFGYYPARQAARMNPIDALRSD